MEKLLKPIIYTCDVTRNILAPLYPSWYHASLYYLLIATASLSLLSLRGGI